MSDNELAEWLKEHIGELIQAVQCANEEGAPPGLYRELEGQLIKINQTIALTLNP